jgi:hypothetical protein
MEPQFRRRDFLIGFLGLVLTGCGYENEQRNVQGRVLSKKIDKRTYILNGASITWTDYNITIAYHDQTRTWNNEKLYGKVSEGMEVDISLRETYRGRGLERKLVQVDILDLRPR